LAQFNLPDWLVEVQFSHLRGLRVTYTQSQNFAQPPYVHGARNGTTLLTSREPVQVVSQRLGHASPVITMTVYAHVLPGSQREAAGLFARIVAGAPS
jgi:integrase